MEYIQVGKLVNTHGIKGEVRILSNFSYKDIIFKKGFKLYIGKEKEVFEIETYRHHKNFDMVVFRGFYDINMVEYLKGMYVYVNKEDLGNNVSYNLIGYKVICNDNIIGCVDSITYNGANEILVLDNNKMIPYVPYYIDKIDNENKSIIINYVKGLID